MKRLCAFAWRPFAAALLGTLFVSCATIGGSSSSSVSGVTHSSVGPLEPSAPSVHEVVQTTSLAGTGVGPATASCPPGELALGGGWELPAPAGGGSFLPARLGTAQVALEGARVFKAVIQGNTWAVSVSHPALRPAETLQVSAYVECLQGVPGAVVTPITTTENAQPQVIGAESATCIQGYPVGFGFDFSDSPAKLEFTGDNVGQTLGLRNWAVTVANHDTVQHAVVVSVQCLSNANVSWQVKSRTGPSVVGAATATVQQACPSGYFVAGGGITYRYSILGAGNVYRQHVGSGGWQASLYASTGSSPLENILVYAACLRFL
jgi:hypothetical protein